MRERPPRFAERLVRWSIARAPWPEALLGDLDERFARSAAVDARRARAEYRRSALSIALRYAPARLSAPELRYEARHAWRGLLRSPVSTVAIIASLALGIGATGAIIGLIDTMYVRKLPVPAPEEIVVLLSATRQTRRFDVSMEWSPHAEFQAIRHSIAGLSGLASYTMDMLHPDGALAGQPVWTAAVSGNYFDVLGIRPQLGRLLRADEETPDGSRGVAIISDHLWRSRFNADATVLGTSVPIGSATVTIVGVTPPGFTGMHPEGRTDLWMPFGLRGAALGDASARGTADGVHVVMFGRRLAGATLAQVQTSATHAAERLASERPAAYRHLSLTARVRDRLTTRELSPGAAYTGIMIWIVVALLHLMVCTNVASLMLARAESKRTEAGVRLCLGASRTRIVLTSLIESVTLALLGGGAGLLVARWLTIRVGSMQFLSAADAGFDLRAVVIAAAIAALSVVQFGVLPALEIGRSDPLAVVRGITSRGKRRNSRAEIAVLVQVAISVALLIDAAAFSSLYAAQHGTEPGYDDRSVVVASIEPKDPRTFRGNIPALYAEASDRIDRTHGIDRVAAAAGAPLLESRWFATVATPEHAGQSIAGDAEQRTSLQAIGPSYFAAIGARLLRGREFTSTDRAATPADADRFDVAIVNESAARKLWPGADPLGRRIVVDSATATVVGIVGDLQDVSTVAPVPRVYLPLLETSNRTLTLVVHTRGDTSVAAEAVRTALESSSLLRPATPRTLRSIREDVVAPSRIASRAFAGAASIALSLACVGLYGLIAMWAARRRRELGIRLALGATPAMVHRLVLEASGSMLATGVVLGGILGTILVQVERSWLGSYLRLDPRFGCVALLCLAVAVVGAAAVALARGLREAVADLLR